MFEASILPKIDLVRRLQRLGLFKQGHVRRVQRIELLEQHLFLMKLLSRLMEGQLQILLQLGCISLERTDFILQLRNAVVALASTRLVTAGSLGHVTPEAGC